eukprot:TRINITY_DN10455_c0_g1_i2.p1 TRINITY_DN10455_c0_g1~~TRINITY_DN10455_c0_g1_i2.p1  ORF type:complete len:410 (+),score=-105.54 TRINITY_DN10455_c0_g1_i2:220-1449(+)
MHTVRFCVQSVRPQKNFSETAALSHWGGCDQAKNRLKRTNASLLLLPFSETHPTKKPFCVNGGSHQRVFAGANVPVCHTGASRYHSPAKIPSSRVFPPQTQHFVVSLFICRVFLFISFIACSTSFVSFEHLLSKQIVQKKQRGSARHVVINTMQYSGIVSMCLGHPKKQSTGKLQHMNRDTEKNHVTKHAISSHLMQPHAGSCVTFLLFVLSSHADQLTVGTRVIHSGRLILVIAGRVYTPDAQSSAQGFSSGPSGIDCPSKAKIRLPHHSCVQEPLSIVGALGGVPQPFFDHGILARSGVPRERERESCCCFLFGVRLQVYVRVFFLEFGVAQQGNFLRDLFFFAAVLRFHPTLTPLHSGAVCRTREGGYLAFQQRKSGVQKRPGGYAVDTIPAVTPSINCACIRLFG